MANWSKTFTNIDNVNSGREFTNSDYPTPQGFNVPINNTQYLYDNCVGTYTQTFTEEQKQQARNNIGLNFHSGNFYTSSFNDLCSLCESLLNNQNVICLSIKRIEPVKEVSQYDVSWQSKTCNLEIDYSRPHESESYLISRIIIDDTSYTSSNFDSQKEKLRYNYYSYITINQ